MKMSVEGDQHTGTAVLLLAIYPPQTLHGLAGDRTCTFSVRTWRLTAWAISNVPDYTQIAVCTSQRPRYASITKTGQLMLYREIIAVCSQIHINTLNPLNTELNPICHLLALLGAHHILHVSRIRVNVLYLFIYSMQLCSTPVLFAATAQS